MIGCPTLVARSWGVPRPCRALLATGWEQTAGCPPDKTQESANAINFVEDVPGTATVESAVEAIFMDMDGGTIVRIVSGLLFLVILGVFILRKRRAA